MSGDIRDIVIHNEAAEEFVDAREWYAQRASMNIAKGFESALDDALQKISKAPLR